MTSTPTWRVSVVRFGRSAPRTSTLAHLIDSTTGRAACGSVPARTIPAPAAATRCDRCLHDRYHRASSSQRGGV